MTREEFKNLAMEIIVQSTCGTDKWTFPLFSSDNMDDFKIAQYDEDDWDVEAAMPLDEFLDELYEVINR